MGSISTPGSEEFDVVIIGAGLSGINAAYRVQTQLPDCTYTVIEARNAIGGTWDLFRYPGIRSDSDLHTFGFPWRPWLEPKAIADGESIRNYIRESAEEFGIDKKIQYQTKLLAADWSSDEQKWSLSVGRKKEGGGMADDMRTLKARFMILSTGYYDYDEALKTNIPNLDTFQGQTIHPQFWPKDLDYSNKKIVLIGSGATAITLFSVLAETAASVTMVQRSPSYILSLPAVDPTGEALRKFFPAWIASRLLRWKYLIQPYLFFQFCRSFPNAAKKIMHKRTQQSLPSDIPLDPHFKPSYNPWEQRLCVCPDGDFYTALKKGNTDIVTDTIKTVTETGLITESGKEIEADIIITATGLKILLAGGTKLSLDGKKLNPNEKFLWKNTMIQDVPNAAVVIGYTNASWTLGSDTAALLICRILKRMRSLGLTSATPSLGTITSDSSNGHITGGPEQKMKLNGHIQTTDPEWHGMKEMKLLDLSSTYVEKAKGVLPKAGDRGPWQPRTNYFADAWGAIFGNITKGLRYEGDRESKKVL
jgi:cation diffusion facilitator CzcD-associated flavoprotein CzcO